MSGTSGSLQAAAIYGVHSFVDSGDLISYATDFAAGFRQGGI
jgi:hypothetical protein